MNARAVEAKRKKQEETRRSKKKHHLCKVGMDLRTAASKVVGMLQAAIQTNKKNGCYPQSIETLSKMFKDLRAGKEVGGCRCAQEQQEECNSLKPSCKKLARLAVYCQQQ